MNFLEHFKVKVVPAANMKHFNQPLNLTVNCSTKHFKRRSLSLVIGKNRRGKLTKVQLTEQIEVDFNLTRLKPIDANWMIEL